jgi:hypothetical protein
VELLIPTQGGGVGAGLEEDLGGDLRLAASPDELDRGMKICIAVRQTLGEWERIPGLDQDVEAPPFDLGALARFVFGDLRHVRFLRLIRPPYGKPCPPSRKT